MTTLNGSEIFTAIAEILADRLAVARDDIELQSTLIGDLGVDSLDVLDVIFCIERRFEIKIRDSGFNKILRGDNPTDGPGQLSPEEIESLAVYLPRLRNHPAGRPVTIPVVWSHVTVESLVILVQERLAQEARQEQETDS